MVLQVAPNLREVVQARDAEFGEQVAAATAEALGRAGAQPHVGGLAEATDALGVPRIEVLAQVDWAVNEELAGTVSDVMIRRTQLFYRDRDQGLGAAEAVAAANLNKEFDPEEHDRLMAKMYDEEYYEDEYNDEEGKVIQCLKL